MLFRKLGKQLSDGQADATSHGASIALAAGQVSLLRLCIVSDAVTVDAGSGESARLLAAIEAQLPEEWRERNQ